LTNIASGITNYRVRNTISELDARSSGNLSLTIRKRVDELIAAKDVKQGKATRISIGKDIHN